jgi:hypothetical protein
MYRSNISSERNRLSYIFLGVLNYEMYQIFLRDMVSSLLIVITAAICSSKNLKMK